MNTRTMKHSVGVLSALALSLAIWVPQSQAQPLQPTPNQQQPASAYVCASGSIHNVTDLKGGDLKEHQTGGTPIFTCLTASKPELNPGPPPRPLYKCPGGPGDLHLVSDLKGGVKAEHQIGSPPFTCIQGSLPGCALGFAPGGNAGQTLKPGQVCVAIAK